MLVRFTLLLLLVLSPPASANFYYTLIDPDKPNFRGNREYYNQIENVQYSGGLEERVGALLMCNRPDFYQTITFVGRNCNKAISTAHAFYDDEGRPYCTGEDKGRVEKWARYNNKALKTSEERSSDVWHGGMDPNRGESYQNPTGRAITFRRYNTKKLGDLDATNHTLTKYRHNDLQLLLMDEVPPPSKTGATMGQTTACSGSPNFEMVDISQYKDHMPLKQCFTYSRFREWEDTGIQQGTLGAQLSIYRMSKYCHVTSIEEKYNTSNRLFHLNCPIAKASSGSPIFCKIEGNFKMVGVVASATLPFNKIHLPRLYDPLGGESNQGVGFPPEFIDKAKE